MMDTQFPLILGFDGAGRVEALGSSADRCAVGELVHGQFWGDALSRGTLAELVAVNEHPSRGALELVPADLDLDLAAAVPTSGMTAVGALERTVCRPGDTVLILGATGGVGVRSRQHSPRSTATASMTSPEPISSTANGSGGSAGGKRPGNNCAPPMGCSRHSACGDSPDLFRSELARSSGADFCPHRMSGARLMSSSCPPSDNA
jgi:hypothetical protein